MPRDESTGLGHNDEITHTKRSAGLLEGMTRTMRESSGTGLPSSDARGNERMMSRIPRLSQNHGFDKSADISPRFARAGPRPSSFFVGAVGHERLGHMEHRSRRVSGEDKNQLRSNYDSIAKTPIPGKTRTSLMSTPYESDTTAESSSSPAVSSSAPPASDSARLVQLALDLSASRKRHASTAKTSSVGVISQKQEQGLNTVPLPTGMAQEHIPSRSFDHDTTVDYLATASPSTLFRVAKAKNFFELAHEYRRLLDRNPAIPLVNKSRHVPSPKNQAQFNPLQTLRNRKVRAREGLAPLVPSEKWQDVNAVRSWVDSIPTVSSPGVTGSHIAEVTSIPRFSEESFRTKSAADGFPSHHQSPSAGQRAVRLHNEWTVEPDELLMDLYWTIQSSGEGHGQRRDLRGKTSPNLENRLPGEKNRPSTDHGKVSSLYSEDHAAIEPPDDPIRSVTSTLASQSNEWQAKGTETSAAHASKLGQARPPVPEHIDHDVQKGPSADIHSFMLRHQSDTSNSLHSSNPIPSHEFDTNEGLSVTQRGKMPHKHMKSASAQLKSKLNRLPGIQLRSRERGESIERSRSLQDDARIPNIDHASHADHVPAHSSLPRPRKTSDDEQRGLQAGGVLLPLLAKSQAETRTGSAHQPYNRYESPGISPKRSAEFANNMDLSSGRGFSIPTSRSSMSADSISTASFAEKGNAEIFTNPKDSLSNTRLSSSQQYHIPNLPVFRSQLGDLQEGSHNRGRPERETLDWLQDANTAPDGQHNFADTSLVQTQPSLDYKSMTGAMSPIPEGLQKVSSKSVIARPGGYGDSDGHDVLALSLQDVARVRAMLLSSGIKAREIVRRETSLKLSPPGSSTESIKATASCPRTALLFTSLPLCDEMDSGLKRAEQAIERFNTNITNMLAIKINEKRQKASDQLIKMVQDVSDEADAFTVELTTRPPRDIKRIDDAIDDMIKRQRRQFRLFRRAGFKLLEWTVLGIMWCIWLLVVLFKVGKKTVVGACKFVRWLVWF